MIVICHQGIGKSTLAHDGNGWIDFKCSNFYIKVPITAMDYKLDKTIETAQGKQLNEIIPR